MSETLRQFVKVARFTGERLLDAMKAPDKQSIQSALEVHAVAVRDVGTRWQDVEDLIAERDALAEKVQK